MRGFSIKTRDYPKWKIRAFINDTPVRLEVMRKISERLMDIHSQHDTLQLGSNIYQLNLVDLTVNWMEK